MKRRLVLLVASLLAVACDDSPAPGFHGYLYFGAGTYLARLDLRNGETSVVTSIGDADLLAVRAQGDARLLLTAYGAVNRREAHRLLLFDRQTRQLMTLFEGREGHYLPDSDVLVYDDGSALKMLRRTAGEWDVRELDRHPPGESVRIVPLSPSEFLYATAHTPVIRRFDLASGTSGALEALSRHCGLDAAIWIDGHDQLLCRPGKDDAYVFATLEGEIRAELQRPGSGPLRALAWLPDQEALVLGETWHGWLSDRQRSAVWLHRPGNGESLRLLEDQPLGEAVVYSAF